MGMRYEDYEAQIAEAHDALQASGTSAETVRAGRAELEAEAEAERRYPALNADDEPLTYPRSALREFRRGSFIAGVAWRAQHPADVAQLKELARQREEAINEAARAENRIGAAKTILDEHLRSLTYNGKCPKRASQCHCLACDIGRALGVIEEVDRG